jgi:hypothetical protein
MSAEALVFLFVRAFHVLLAATWVGVTVFLVFFLMPATKEAGPGAGPVMGALTRRNLNGFIGAVGGFAVLSGFYLYWRFTGHFDPETHAALLKAYDRWDSVLMPVHAADHSYRSFEKTALPVAVEKGIGVEAVYCHFS